LPVREVGGLLPGKTTVVHIRAWARKKMGKNFGCSKVTRPGITFKNKEKPEGERRGGWRGMTANRLTFRKTVPKRMKRPLV